MEKRLGIFEIIIMILKKRKAVTIDGKEFFSEEALLELTKLAEFAKSTGILFYFNVTEGEYYYHLNQCVTYRLNKLGITPTSLHQFEYLSR